MAEVKDVVDFNGAWYSTADEKEREMFREWLLGVLNMHKDVAITFEKKDGTLREMKCTLHRDIIPPVIDPEASDNLCIVWDTEKNAWRSFHFEKIKQINFQL